MTTKAHTARRDECRSCYFWNKAKRARWTDISDGGGSIEIEHAQCRRYAPGARRASATGNSLPEPMWPHVNANDWCGEHSSAQP